MLQWMRTGSPGTDPRGEMRSGRGPRPGPSGPSQQELAAQLVQAGAGNAEALVAAVEDGLEQSAPASGRAPAPGPPGPPPGPRRRPWPPSCCPGPGCCCPCGCGCCIPPLRSASGAGGPGASGLRSGLRRRCRRRRRGPHFPIPPSPRWRRCHSGQGPPSARRPPPPEAACPSSSSSAAPPPSPVT